MGVENRSSPSRKKGRFSGKKRAKRSLLEICATSDSTCEKSGLMVASIAVTALGFHLASIPPSHFVLPESREPGAPTAVWSSLPVAYGARTKWLPEGSPVRPTSFCPWQMKQLDSRGSL